MRLFRDQSEFKGYFFLRKKRFKVMWRQRSFLRIFWQADKEGLNKSINKIQALEEWC